MLNTKLGNNIGWLKLERDRRDEELGEISTDDESESSIFGLPSFAALVSTILAIILYLITGPALIFLNKHILVIFDFPYPVFVSSLGLWASVFISRLCVYTGITKLTVKISWENYLTGIVPSCFFMALTLYTGNRSYFYLSVSLIQLIKALSPVMALILSIFFKPNEKRTWIEWSAIIVICIGTIFGSIKATTNEFSWFGILLALIAGFTECARLLYIQIFLQDLKLPTMEGLYYYAPPAVFWSSILILILEIDAFRLKESQHRFMAHIYYFIAAGFLGFAVNFAGFLVIKQTSAVALKVLGVVRGVGLVIVSVIFFNDIVSGQQFIGFVVSTLGVFWYNYEKIKKKKKKIAYTYIDDDDSETTHDEILGVIEFTNLKKIDDFERSETVSIKSICSDEESTSE